MLTTTANDPATTNRSKKEAGGVMGYPITDRGVSRRTAVTNTAAKSRRVVVYMAGRASDNRGANRIAITAIRGASIRLGQYRNAGRVNTRIRTTSSNMIITAAEMDSIVTSLRAIIHRMRNNIHNVMSDAFNRMGVPESMFRVEFSLEDELAVILITYNTSTFAPGLIVPLNQCMIKIAYHADHEDQSPFLAVNDLFKRSRTEILMTYLVNHPIDLSNA